MPFQFNAFSVITCRERDGWTCGKLAHNRGKRFSLLFQPKGRTMPSLLQDESYNLAGRFVSSLRLMSNRRRPCSRGLGRHETGRSHFLWDQYISRQWVWRCCCRWGQSLHTISFHLSPIGSIGTLSLNPPFRNMWACASLHPNVLSPRPILCQLYFL